MLCRFSPITFIVRVPRLLHNRSAQSAYHNILQAQSPVRVVPALSHRYRHICISRQSRAGENSWSRSLRTVQCTLHRCRGVVCSASYANRSRALVFINITSSWAMCVHSTGAQPMNIITDDSLIYISWTRAHLFVLILCTIWWIWIYRPPVRNILMQSFARKFSACFIFASKNKFRYRRPNQLADSTGRVSKYPR